MPVVRRSCSWSLLVPVVAPPLPRPLLYWEGLWVWSELVWTTSRSWWWLLWWLLVVSPILIPAAPSPSTLWAWPPLTALDHAVLVDRLRSDSDQ